MKERVWHTQRAFTNEAEQVVLPPDGGDEEALQVAQALANVCDAETLRSLLDLKILLDRVGGEAYVGALRIKVDTNGHRIPPEQMRDPERPGTYLTSGYLFVWNPVAQKTKVAVQSDEEPQPDLREPFESEPQMVRPEAVPDSDPEHPFDPEAQPAQTPEPEPVGT